MKVKLIGVTLLIAVSVTGCFKAEEAVKLMEPVIQSTACLSSFYKSNNRLPKDNNELIQFAKAESLALDLSKFKVFHYYQKSDSTLAFDYVLMPPVESGGTIEIKPDYSKN